MTTTSQTTAQSTEIRQANLLAIDVLSNVLCSLQSPFSGSLCLRWGHNRLVSISHIRVIIVKWDNDLVLRWHLFIFLNFAVLIFQETHIKHTQDTAKSTAERKRKERRKTHKIHTHSWDAVARPDLLMIIGEPWKSTASIWLYCQCNVPLRFHATANRLLTICIRRAIDQRSGRDWTKHETPAN